MPNFIDELSSVSRTDDQIAKDNNTRKIQKINDSMKISDSLLKEFDEQFLSALKSNIKTRAYNGEFVKLDNGMNKMEGVFSYRQRYKPIGLSVDYFEGITFPSSTARHGRKNMAFDLKLIVVEDETKKSLFKETNGVKFYINEPILEHIKKIVKDEGITITSIEGWPETNKFISERKFFKSYTNISVDFKYEIIY